MRRNDRFDGDMEGQLTIENIFEPPERLFAISKIFARAKRDMSLAEQKTFVYALSEMKFTEKATTPYIRLDKKILAGILGIKSDPDHLSVDLYDNIRELPKHSYIEINEPELDLQSNGFVITALTRFKNVIRLRFNEEYLGLFTGLSANYITMWSSDIFKMKTKRSIQFYEHLRQNTDTRHDTQEIGLGIKALKDLFGIPKDGEGSYMRKDGHFDRTAFERRIIEPLCEDMKHCKMISLLTQPDGKMYEKVKRGNRVLGYRFYWTFSAHPAVATAEEVKQIQDRVDKNPQVLKVAKDIVKGEKKKRTDQGKGNRFNNFQQREYDFEELERQLLKAQVQQSEKERTNDT